MLQACEHFHSNILSFENRCNQIQSNTILWTHYQTYKTHPLHTLDSFQKLFALVFVILIRMNNSMHNFFPFVTVTFQSSCDVCSITILHSFGFCVFSFSTHRFLFTRHFESITCIEFHPKNHQFNCRFD